MLLRRTLAASSLLKRPLLPDSDAALKTQSGAKLTWSKRSAARLTSAFTLCSMLRASRASKCSFLNS